MNEFRWMARGDCWQRNLRGQGGVLLNYMLDREGNVIDASHGYENKGVLLGGHLLTSNKSTFRDLFAFS